MTVDARAKSSKELVVACSTTTDTTQEKEVCLEVHIEGNQ